MKSCDTKKFYDTEFEAEIAAAKFEGVTGAMMVPYKCGRHFHITHADPDQRRGYGIYWRCPRCKQIIKRGKIKSHRIKCRMKP